ncbi:hypothetical protein FDH01_gp280 [Acinetobacter phage vB_AbaM_ME3]|uniref:Uncharacterized protein n=1 Tax=Acinetobacter phage vB_AbaM_ME3 TaxID=1837876 RepID=A0A172Q0G0_9CAUD|nr:hypothetical protein FDH01_gp280 [Acinetobacter phage vB_AbaM_ME3]AND75342.1 hypothetical protein ME3_181 [Acinetobacter phage vB_AbaM_ME3]
MSFRADQVTRYKIDDLVKPKNGLFQIYIDHYWVVDNENNVLKYLDRTWQCNSNKELARRFQEKVYPEYSIKKIPIIYAEWKN